MQHSDKLCEDLQRNGIYEIILAVSKQFQLIISGKQFPQELTRSQPQGILIRIQNTIQTPKSPNKCFIFGHTYIIIH